MTVATFSGHEVLVEAGVPMSFPDRTTFAINRKTAAAIAVAIPDEWMLRATKVIG